MRPKIPFEAYSIRDLLRGKCDAHGMSEFDPNDRVAIQAALEDPDPRNPLAVAIARRIEAYASSMAQQVAAEGKWPRKLQLVEPETILEEVALQLAVKTISQELGEAIEIQWVVDRLH